MILFEFSKQTGLCDTHWHIGYLYRSFRKCKNPLGYVVLLWQHGPKEKFGSLRTMCSKWGCDHMQEPESAKSSSHEQNSLLQQGRKQESCIDGKLYILICLSLQPHLHFHFSSWLNPGKINPRIQFILDKWQIPFSLLDWVLHLNLCVVFYP